MALNALSLSVAVGYTGYSFKSAVVGLTAGSEVEMRRGFGDGFGYSNGFVRSEGLPTPDSWFELVEYLPATGERRVSRLDVKSFRYDLDVQAAFKANPTATGFSPAPITNADGSRTWGVAVRGPTGTTIIKTGGGPGTDDIPKFPNFPSTTRQIRTDADIATRSSGIYPVTFVPSTDFPDGRNVVSMIVNGANAYNQATMRGTFPAPVDMSNGNLALWLKRMASGECQVEIDLYSAGSPTSAPANYVTLNMYTGFLNFTLDPGKDANTPGVFGKVGNRTSRFAVVGAGANLSAITHYQIRLGDKSGSAFSVQVSDLVFTPNPRTKAAIILRMDDAWKDVYTGLKPMFEAAGLTQMPFLLSPGAVASTSGIDGPPSNNRLTSAQVNEMRPRGWQVGTQAWTTEGSQISYAAYMVEYNGMMQYNRDRGWISDAGDGTYYSNVNMGTPNARAAMIEAGSRTCQRFVNGSQTTPSFARNETFPPVDQMQMMAMNLAGFAPNLGATPARSVTSQLQAQINRVVEENGLLIIAGHQDMFQVEVERQALQDLITRYVNVGDFELHTPNTLFNPWLALYGPAPVYAAAYSGKTQ